MNREEMLQKRIDELEKENRYLKGLLDDVGISQKNSTLGSLKNHMMKIKEQELYTGR